MPVVLRVVVVLAVLLACAEARAFCGFYVAGSGARLFNDATNVVLLRDGTRTVLSMQNAYQGPPEAFAMVVPVPVVLHAEDVKTLPREVFDRIDLMASPRLVEYWEHDPCDPPRPDAQYEVAPASRVSPKGQVEMGGAYHVTIEAQFVVGEYEVVVLGADDSAGLDAWLRDHGYAIPQGAEPYLRPYVQAGSKFFVAKVDPAKVAFEGGRAMLSPLRFHYDSDTFSLPIRLGLVNSGGTQDLVVNVLARGQRYEAANYPNVTIPTNLDVGEDVRDRFPAFYAALFDATVARNPRAVVTEYSSYAFVCDPCPGPTLREGELRTLGADQLRDGNVGQLVLTRLHARYAKDSLGEDIVFRPAPPIEGGREEYDWRAGRAFARKGAQPFGQNFFQGRYVVRHPWAGPVECRRPMFGRWGAPPGDDVAAPRPVAASRAAFAPRGGVELASMLREDATEVGVTALQRTESPEDRFARWRTRKLLLSPGALLGAMGTLAVAGLLLSQRKRRA